MFLVLTSWPPLPRRCRKKADVRENASENPSLAQILRLPLRQLVRPESKTSPTIGPFSIFGEPAARRAQKTNAPQKAG